MPRPYKVRAGVPDLPGEEGEHELRRYGGAGRALGIVGRMNAKMVEAVRGRLEGMGSEELLRLWRENDRERYAEEAFEAARLILVGRGVEVPAQEPAVGRVPVARKARSADPATDEFWMGWLRPVLWVGIAYSGVRCLYELIGVTVMIRTDSPIEWPTVHSFSILIDAIQRVLSFILPFVFIAGASASLRQLSVGRWALLVWGWAEAGSCAVAVLRQASMVAFGSGGLLQSITWALYDLEGTMMAGAYALLVVFFLTRPQIERLFEAPVVGFDLATPGKEAGEESDQ